MPAVGSQVPGCISAGGIPVVKLFLLVSAAEVSLDHCKFLCKKVILLVSA